MSDPAVQWAEYVDSGRRRRSTATAGWSRPSRSSSRAVRCLTSRW